MTIWPKTIECKVSGPEQSSQWIEIFIDEETTDPSGPDPVTVCLTFEQVSQLIDKLMNAYPPVRSKEYARGFLSGKASVQFPVCACAFADDEETILRPCDAHAAWLKAGTEL